MGGASSSEIGAAIGKGFGSLIGVSDYITGDQISDLNQNLNNAQDQLNLYFKNATLSALKNEQKEIENVITWVNSNNQIITESMNLQYNILNGNIKKENSFIVLISILILIIIFFIIIKK